MGICMPANLPKQLGDDIASGKLTQDEADVIMAAAVGADDSAKTGGNGDGSLTVKEWEEYKKVTTLPKKVQDYMGEGLFRGYFGNCGAIKLKKADSE